MMTFSKARLMRAVASAMLAAPALLLIPAVAAASYPSKPVRLVLPLAPGGAMDVLGRAIAQELGTNWGVPVVVENRAGAGGIIASDLVARSAPDGHTLLLSGDSLVTALTVFPDKVTYDPIKDFAPISIAATSLTTLVVRDKSPLKSLQDVVSQARQQPVSIGTPGHGNNNHFALVSLQNGVPDATFRHVPYKGAGPAIVGTLSGEVDAAVVAVPAAVSLVRGGELRSLVVFQGTSGALPGVPTAKEAGLELDTKTGWFGLLAPAGTPPEVVAQIQRAVADAIQSGPFRETLIQQGFEPVGSTSEAFAERLRSDIVTLPELLKSVGVKAD